MDAAARPCSLDGEEIGMKDIDELAYRLWSVHPNEIDEWEKTAPKMPDGYEGGMRVWFYACEIRKLVEFDSDCAAVQSDDLEELLRFAFAAGLGKHPVDLNTAERLRLKKFTPCPRSTYQRVEAAVEGNVLWRFWMKKARELAEKNGELRKAKEQERLRFEGDLDKWMKALGAGITGSQPEAYALMDAAVEELVKLRAAISA
ncbi:hypothetical protein EV128_125142 [Rhizobium azibense]|nr:hypothetical protein EV128_125142 [Rhizobium azibense]